MASQKTLWRQKSLSNGMFIQQLGWQRRKHQSFAFLDLCKVNPTVAGRFPSQRGSNGKAFPYENVFAYRGNVKQSHGLALIYRSDIILCWERWKTNVGIMSTWSSLMEPRVVRISIVSSLVTSESINRSDNLGPCLLIWINFNRCMDK